MTKEELRDIYFGFYDQLIEPERSRAKKNWDYEWVITEKVPNSVIDAVNNGFQWKDTFPLQGIDYWRRVSQYIEDYLVKECDTIKENKPNIMTTEKQETHFEAFVQKQREVLLRKGNDYSSIDRLSNFKLAGSICGLTPEQNCLSLIATKVARLGVLLGGKIPNNESIQDSVLDLANYAILLDMIISEKLAEWDKLSVSK